jgi:hypothetical protein
MLLSLHRCALAGFCLVALLAGAEEPTKHQCLDAYTRSQPLRAHGALKEARAALLICSRAPCPAALQADCMGWLKEVLDAMPSIVPSVKDGRGTDLLEVRVSVDGAQVASRLDGKPLELEPGEHVLRFESGADFVEQRIVARAGEKVRVVEAQLGSPPPEVRRSEPVSAVSGGVSPPVPRSVFALGATGIVAFAVFAGTGIAGVAHWSSLAACKPDCPTERVSAVSREFWGADIALGVAVAAVAAAVILYLVR